MRYAQPEVSSMRWWNQHEIKPLSVCVGPPAAAASTWWISDNSPGIPQPGVRVSPSRRMIALRCWAVKMRSGEPNWMIRPFWSKTIFCSPPVQAN